MPLHLFDPLLATVEPPIPSFVGICLSGAREIMCFEAVVSLAGSRLVVLFVMHVEPVDGTGSGGCLV